MKTVYQAKELTPAKVAQLVREGQKFRTVNRSISGDPEPDAGDVGQLPVAIADRYRREVRAGAITYVIRSYYTPIAWLVRRAGVSSLEVEEVTYSPTTTQWQYTVQRVAELLPS